MFQEDLRFRLQARELCEYLHNRVSLRRAKDVFKYDADRFCLPLSGPDICFSNEPIGPRWALLYEDLLRSEGITHFRLVPLPAEQYPLTNLQHSGSFYIMTVDIPRGATVAPVLSPYRLEVFSGQPDLAPGRPEQLGEYKLRRAYEVWLAGKPLNLLPGALLDFMSNFAEEAQHFYTFIDHAPLQVDRIKWGSYRYPLIDFLYFSAVTITTVGYGDILPNDAVVRTLV